MHTTRLCSHLSVAACLAFVCLVCSKSALAQGYRLEANRLAVDPDDWRDWSAAPGTAQFDANGVLPALIAGANQAVVGISVLAAGTDAGRAVNATDGDISTFWEPDVDEPKANWWLELDLGRMVNATRIILHFADEGDGDPFYQFNVLVSEGTTAFAGSKAVSYTRVGRSELPNTTRRRFDFDLTPRRPADGDFVGDPIRFVMLQLTDSRGGRAEEITASAWDGLDAGRQGAVDYYRREVAGSLRLIDADQYESLAPERQGPIRFYRRELPRLTEIEVLTAGQNLGLSILDREGALNGFGDLGSEQLVVDGDFNTAWATPSAYANPVENPERSLIVDLGASFWLERLHLLYNVTQASGPFPNYVMRVSDGARAPDGSLVWTPISARGVGDFNTIGNVIGPDEVITEFQSIVFPPTRTRFFRLDYLVQVFSGCAGLGCSASVREIQFYGGGYLPEVRLESPLIELGNRPLTLDNITWEADVPDGTELDIRTRSGNDLSRLVRFFTTTGTEVTETQYRALLSFQRGDSLVTVIPGDDWSNWSQRYEETGDVVASPSPRQYLQLEATLRSEDPRLAARLQRLAVTLQSPLAAQLVAEMSPLRIEDTGTDALFTLYVRPEFEGSDPGFQQLLIDGPPGARLALVDVVAGTEEQLSDGTTTGLDVSLRSTQADSLWLQLPTNFRTNGELLAVQFNARLFGAGNPFAVAAGRDKGGIVRWQQVDGGEASVLGEGRGLNVLAPFAESLVRQVEVRPRVFSPNGDGINDEVTFLFSVFKIAVEKSMFVELYDLSGRRVQRLTSPAGVPVGEQSLTWDGRGDNGDLVPPGLYLARFGLDVDATDDRGATVTRMVAVTY